MQKIFVLATLLSLAMCGTALAADISVHGDLNNRFNLFTNQSQLYKGAESISGTPIQEDSNSAFWGDIKYRLWTEVATNDGKVRGVYAIELGALRFGQKDYPKGGGGGYSGDGVNIETRWAYLDFQLPSVQNKARVQIGLFPWMVNSFVWQETVMGVQLKGDAGPLAYNLGWARGHENYPTSTSPNSFQDADALLARGDFKLMKDTKLGLFALWQHQDAFDGTGQVSYEIKRFGNNKYDLFTLGTDGTYSTPTSFGNMFAKWDAIYQGGTIDQPGDLDVSAFLVHADLGVNLHKVRLTYTGWYSSGDDDPNDGNIDNFMSTDVDRFDSVIFFEGGYTDDNYFTEAPYILDKGLILNKVSADYLATEKTTVGAAILYLMTAEDLPLANGSDENSLGTEFDAYIKHKLYPNVELALNAGYLAAGDAMDYFEEPALQDGSSDSNIFRSTMRVRYKF